MKLMHPTSLVIAAAMLLPLAHAGSVQPSRLVAPEHVERQVEELSARFSISDRATDPFGQAQDPKDGHIIRVTPPVPPVPQPIFANAVARIPVEALVPKQQRVMIAGTFVEVGHVFPARFKRWIFQVEVNQVRAGEVDFRNVKTDEIVTHHLKQAPEILQQEPVRPNFAPDPLIDLN